MAFGGGPSEGGGSISDINVTPLVDVMLVLLIIFMVTAPILQQGVAIDLPKVAASPLAGDEEQLVVNVNKAGQVFLNDTPMALDALTTKLAAGLHRQLDRLRRRFRWLRLIVWLRQVNRNLVRQHRHRDHEDDQQHEHDVDERRHVDVGHRPAAAALAKCHLSLPQLEPVPCACVMNPSFTIWALFASDITV